MAELSLFLKAFTKAITEEMEAMRRDLGAHEIPLGIPQASPPSYENNCIQFTRPRDADKLYIGMECSLRCDQREVRIEIATLDDNALVVQSDIPIDSDCTQYALIVYPWFLYERLISRINAIGTSDSFYPESALRLFAKIPPNLTSDQPAKLEHADLNESQFRAVNLCSQSDTAFVWGPPGTGKTRTLAAVLAELLARGTRTLVVSTTHVAVDQALANLSVLPFVRSHIDAGKVVRVGHAVSTPDGLDLDSIAAKINAECSEKLHVLQDRKVLRSHQERQLKKMLTTLSEGKQDEQLGLFSSPPQPRTDIRRDLHGVVGSILAEQWLLAPSPSLKAALAQRLRRVQKVLNGLEARTGALRKELAQGVRTAIQRADLVFCTMSTAYVHRILCEERFDAVVIEEAGMAVLPTLFYCACLAKNKVIAVGDPRQLPPIVQSRNPAVQRAMGRNIFEVSGALEPVFSHVALLNIQYRMHPHIGQLVSDLYYDHQLLHDRKFSAKPVPISPFIEHVLVLVDTSGHTRCEITQRHSRLNVESAAITAALAHQAAATGQWTVGIITPYSEQAKYIGQLVQKDGRSLSNVESSTVHRFQGQERDIILFDTVDTEPLKPGILLNGPSGADQLLNVSLSRARSKLIVLADIAFYLRRAPDGEVGRLIGALQHNPHCLQIQASALEDIH